MGAIIGGIGSLVGSGQEAKYDKQASRQAMTGYNYLHDNALVNQAQTAGGQALTGEGDITGSIRQLLTSPSQNNPAFQNYLNSTGYNFQLDQGSRAITGNAASKGLLNSGATARALEGYGQHLASTTFNNYLSNLGGLAGLYGQQADRGLNAADAVGQAGTTGGGNSGQFLAAAGQAKGTGITNAFNMFGSAANSFLPF